jgi:hypothetical protein
MLDSSWGIDGGHPDQSTARPITLKQLTRNNQPDFPAESRRFCS